MNNGMKPIKYDVNGILLLNKPLEMTSNAALQQVKRLYSAKKAGHTGSLDPLATGMLPLCFGEATKFSQYLLEANKYYRVTGLLGVRTSTADAEGEVIATHPVNVSSEQLLAAIAKFTGALDQVPPMYSAIKVQGQPLYKLARQGIEIERAARRITIVSSELVNFSGAEFTLDVHCSKGTYIRTLIEDIGLTLGCGAHVIALHRSAVTPFQGFPVYTLDELRAIHEQAGRAGLHPLLLAADTAIQSMPAVTLSAASVFYLRTGQAVMVSDRQIQGMVRIFSASGEFLGIGEMLEDGRVAPKRLLSQAQKGLQQAV